MQEFEDSHPLSGKSTADEDGGVRRELGMLSDAWSHWGVPWACTRSASTTACSSWTASRAWGCPQNPWPPRCWAPSPSSQPSKVHAISAQDFCEPVAFESALNLSSISFFAPALAHAFEHLGVDR